MKALVIEHGQVGVVADSAIGRDVMPLFMPAIGGITLDVGVAYRIGRLGKSIRSKFAPRYIDAVGAVCLLNIDGDPATAAYIDGRITTGQWLPYVAENAEIEISVNGQRLVADNRQVAESIERITGYATIKSGDLIIMPLGLRLQNVTEIKATVDGHPALNVRVK